MSELIESNNRYRTRAKSEDGKFYIHTVFYDDESLEQNQRIRLSGMLDKSKLNLHDDEDVRCVISCPDSEQWGIFKRKHFETYKLLTTRGTAHSDEIDRRKGVQQLQILHPAWVIYKRI